jgi:crossover junction endodeoxyribonuclease RuvC
MAAGLSRDILLRNTNPRKLKWRLPETEMLVRTVAKMLQQLLGLKELPKNLDSTDGLAAALFVIFSILGKWLERKVIEVGMLL